MGGMDVSDAKLLARSCQLETSVRLPTVDCGNKGAVRRQPHLSAPSTRSLEDIDRGSQVVVTAGKVACGLQGQDSQARFVAG
jgi:hypothetical protein